LEFGHTHFRIVDREPPFTDNDGDRQAKVFQKIGNEEPVYPPGISEAVKDLMQKLPENRIGSGPRGMDALKRHRWFQDLVWEDVQAGRLEPEWVPDVVCGERVL
jgi:p70 ribosomal S6 kinase